MLFRYQNNTNVTEMSGSTPSPAPQPPPSPQQQQQAPPQYPPAQRMPLHHYNQHQVNMCKDTLKVDKVKKHKNEV